MITKLTGILTRITDDAARIEVGAFEYEVMVAETTRRQLQIRTGHELTLHIYEYYEGNQAGSRLVPRKIGFMYESELEFFDLFCTVDKVGVKKALKAMARPVKDIAEAVTRQDVRWLSTLPGIGPSTAEQMVTTLKKKVARFAVTASPTTSDESESPGNAVAAAGDAAPKRRKKVVEPSAPPLPTVDARVIEDVYEMLMALGLQPVEARSKLDAVLTSGKAFTTADEALKLIYGKG